MKIFYYEDEFENLLEEEDAQESSFEELLDYLYNLESDGVSYVGFIINDKKFKILSTNYDKYTICLFNYIDFECVKILNFEELKIYTRETLGLKNDRIYKIHEGKEYTKEEWDKYQEEQRKNRPPGTTWSLLDDED